MPTAELIGVPATPELPSQALKTSEAAPMNEPSVGTKRTRENASSGIVRAAETLPRLVQPASCGRLNCQAPAPVAPTTPMPGLLRASGSEKLPANSDPTLVPAGFDTPADCDGNSGV